MNKFYKKKLMQVVTELVSKDNKFVDIVKLDNVKSLYRKTTGSTLELTSKTLHKMWSRYNQSKETLNDESILVIKIINIESKEEIERHEIVTHQRFAVDIGYEIIYGEVTPDGLDIFVRVIEG